MPDEPATLVGIDTGGTFTDFAVCTPDGLISHKVLSRPEVPDEAILQGLEELGLSDHALRIHHGSTVATNAVLERRGGSVVYVTNRGLSDVLTIGRQQRSELYRLSMPPVAPPVAASHCLETGGRLAADGTLVEPLSDADIAELVVAVEALAPEAVAINLLFSFLDDDPERRLEAALSDRWPVSRSSRVLPQAGEYERGIATWLNAYVAPRTGRYLARLGQRLGSSRLAVMQSDGLLTDAASAAAHGVRLLLSGPAGGLVGARTLGASAGLDRLITLDVGGTSTDVALIDGEIQITSEGQLGPFPVAVPMVDMHTVGAGGGSIASIDDAGMLHVGPESAGADPGPACYGRGGTQATVTDAFVVAGRLPDGASLGRGGVKLDRHQAVAAFEPLAQGLERSVEAAAEAVIRLANEKMAGALKVISVQRGRDPRGFVLCAFGGAGGLHACELAELLGMKRVLVPAAAGVLSAVGMAAAAPGREVTRAALVPLAELNETELAGSFEHMQRQLHHQLIAGGHRVETFEQRVDLRYRGQSFTLTLPWQGREQTSLAFHHAHETRFGHALKFPIELVNLRVRGQGAAPELTLGIFAASIQCNEPRGGSVIDRATLRPGSPVAGAATIMDATGACWVAPAWTAHQDANGNLLLEKQH